MLCAFLVGGAGKSFSVGSAGWPRGSQKPAGLCDGLFARATSARRCEVHRAVLIADRSAAGISEDYSWRLAFRAVLYAGVLMTMFVIISSSRRAPITCQARAPNPRDGEPLRDLRCGVSAYYTVTFGAYVAMSVWLPKYFVSVYDLPCTGSADDDAIYLASSLLRPFGEYFR